MSLKFSYTLIAPFYDAFIDRAFSGVRARSLGQLPREEPGRVLINGIGTGLDLPFLPAEHAYVGLDLTPAMLKQADSRRGALDLHLVQGNGMALPFADNSFDHAVLHLILAVVPNPFALLLETARVVKEGGHVLVLDKFLRPGQGAWIRRALSPLAGRIATRLDVVFEDVLARVPQLGVEADQPAMAGGWFRAIRLVKRG